MKSALTFRIDGDTAIGTLKSGKEFLIDTADVERVKALSWRVNKDGYLSHFDHLLSNELLLHRWLMDAHNSNVIIDHINHDRLDCRRSNLRIVTPTQNSANHSFFKTNKTGYTGVYFSRSSDRYEVKIGYDHKRILLGTTKDKNQLITLAQMYNIGASFFFGDFAGAMNDVPQPSDELVETVIAKCQRHLKPSQRGAASAA